MADENNRGAIKTEYNGYVFRSRLEARWAMLFDNIKIRYEYEYEGYENDGIKYLPDFYFPDHDIYGEVKGDPESLAKDMHKIIAAIDYDATPVSKGLIILGNIPSYYFSIPIFYFLYHYKGVACGTCIFDVWQGKGGIYTSQNELAKECYSLEDTNFEFSSCRKDEMIKIFRDEHFLSNYHEWDGEGTLCSDPYYICCEYEKVRKYSFWR